MLTACHVRPTAVWYMDFFRFIQLGEVVIRCSRERGDATCR